MKKMHFTCKMEVYSFAKNRVPDGRLSSENVKRVYTCAPKVQRVVVTRRAEFKLEE